MLGRQILFDREDPRRSRVRIWVDLSSIDTGSEERNDYILSTGLFDMRWEPALVFDSEHVDIDDVQHGAVVGSLTLQSIRKQIVVNIEASVPQRDSSGAWRFIGTARTSISRAAFGLRRPRRPGDLLSDEMLGDDIEMAAEIEATPAHSTSVLLPIARRNSDDGGSTTPSAVQRGVVGSGAKRISL